MDAKLRLVKHEVNHTCSILKNVGDNVILNTIQLEGISSTVVWLQNRVESLEESLFQKLVRVVGGLILLG